MPAKRENTICQNNVIKRLSDERPTDGRNLVKAASIDTTTSTTVTIIEFDDKGDDDDVSLLDNMSNEFRILYERKMISKLAHDDENHNDYFFDNQQELTKTKEREYSNKEKRHSKNRILSSLSRKLRRQRQQQQ